MLPGLSTTRFKPGRVSVIQLFDALITRLRCKHQYRHSHSKPGIPVCKCCRKRKPTP